MRGLQEKISKLRADERTVEIGNRAKQPTKHKRDNEDDWEFVAPCEGTSS